MDVIYESVAELGYRMSRASLYDLQKKKQCIKPLVGGFFSIFFFLSSSSVFDRGFFFFFHIDIVARRRASVSVIHKNEQAANVCACFYINIFITTTSSDGDAGFTARGAADGEVPLYLPRAYLQRPRGESVD